MVVIRSYFQTEIKLNCNIKKHLIYFWRNPGEETYIIIWKAQLYAVSSNFILIIF